MFDINANSLSGNNLPLYLYIENQQIRTTKGPWQLRR